MNPDDFNKNSKIVHICIYFVHNKLCFTYSVRYFVKASVLTNVVSKR